MTFLQLQVRQPHRPLTELRAETKRVSDAVEGARTRHTEVARDLTRKSLDQIDRSSDVHATIQSMVGKLKAGASALKAAEEAIALSKRDQTPR